ncbi:MAG: LysE family translocator [Sphingomicrobium sp.]
MTTVSLLAYAAALLLAAVTPGPAMFAVISTGLSRAARQAIAAGAGVALGDLLLAALALLGLAAIAESYGWLFGLIKFAGAAYLIWLGIRMWRAPVRIEAEPAGGERGSRTLVLGTAIALGNPKAILFHASLMPLILDLRSLTWNGAVIILALVVAINLAVMSGYGILAGRAQRLFRTPRRLRWMNRIGGGAMIGTGAVMASR